MKTRKRSPEEIQFINDALSRLTTVERNQWDQRVAVYLFIGITVSALIIGLAALAIALVLILR